VSDCSDSACREALVADFGDKVVIIENFTMKKDGAAHTDFCVGDATSRRCFLDIGKVLDEVWAPSSKDWVDDKVIAEAWDADSGKTLVDMQREHDKANEAPGAPAKN
jgi:hypothetical protein